MFGYIGLICVYLFIVFIVFNVVTVDIYTKVRRETSAADAWIALGWPLIFICICIVTLLYTLIKITEFLLLAINVKVNFIKKLKPTNKLRKYWES